MSSPQIGRFYAVPCMYVGERAREWWQPRDGWVPVMGPKHNDVEHIRFVYEHFHIDWRFMPTPEWNALIGMKSGRTGSALAKVLTNTGQGLGNIQGVPVQKRRMCKREMPVFPSSPKSRPYPAGENWQALERAHACSRLKPGNICPHRGIDLTPFVKPDGTVVCPGHGLAWDTRTGKRLAHHTAEVAS